jgi:hypothetical protein
MVEDCDWFELQSKVNQDDPEIRIFVRMMSHFHLPSLQACTQVQLSMQTGLHQNIECPKSKISEVNQLNRTLVGRNTNEIQWFQFVR